MTTINTIEDLIKLLDENPEWLEAVRSRVLTREVLELPERVDLLSERVDLLSERVDLLSERVDRISERVDRISERVDLLSERVDLLSERVDRLSETVNRLSQVVESFVEATNRRFNATDNALATIRNDIGILKAGHARNSVLGATTAITDAMGLDRVRDLTYDDLRALTLAADTSDIPTNIILSFRQADLVMEAADQAGETCYVAVEISYTADHRDTDRALRNADFLTRFTGHTAYAVVAGVHRDDRVEQLSATGQVFWRQLESRDLEVA